MQAIEFETLIVGNKLEIPTQYLQQIGDKSSVKVIVLMADKKELSSSIDSLPLKERLLAIAHGCAKLPLLDSRTDHEILSYDEHGMPSL